MKTKYQISIISAITIAIIIGIVYAGFSYQETYDKNCIAGGGKVTGFLRCTLIHEDFGLSNSYTIDLELGKTFEIKYRIEGAKINQIIRDDNQMAVNVHLESTHDGFLQITIPRDLIDAKIGESDDDFFVIVDDVATPYDEIVNEYERTLIIELQKGTKLVQIIGTNPNF